MIKRIIVAVAVCTLIFGSGCISVRRKFIRKKKYQKEEPVYVDFKEYKSVPAGELYSEYYSFLDGWLSELAGIFSGPGSLKRAKECLAQGLMNFEQMLSLCNEGGRLKLEVLCRDLIEVKNELEKQGIGNEITRGALLRKTEYIQRRLRRDFNYREAAKSLK